MKPIKQGNVRKHFSVLNVRLFAVASNH